MCFCINSCWPGAYTDRANTDWCVVITMLYSAGKLFIIAFVLVFPAIGFAAQNKLDWSVRGEYEHNNNISLASENPQSTAATHLKPVLDYRYDDGVNAIQGGSTLTFNQFNDDRYNSDDQLFKLGYTHTGEVSTQSIQLNSNRNSTRTSELDDTGFVGQQATRRVRNMANLSWQQLLSETDSLALTGFYQKTNYQSNSLADHSQEGLSISWRHLYSPRLSSSWQLYYQEFDSKLFQPVYGIAAHISTTSRTKGGRVSVDYQLSEIWKFSANAGISSIDTNQDYRSEYFDISNAGSNTSNIYSITLSRLGESNTLKFSASQDTETSGSGTLRVVQKLDGSLSQSFNQRCKLTSSAYYAKHKSLNDKLVSFSNEDRDYYTVKFDLAYQIQQFWWLSLVARYQNQQFVNTDNYAEAVIGGIAITYRPNATLW